MPCAVATHNASLPGVTWLNGERVTGAAVRALTGADEMALAPMLGHASPLKIGIAIVERCCPQFHTVSGLVDTAPSLVSSLAVGDREALLLHVQAATFGNRIALVVDCPACDEAMDLPLDVAELLVPPLDEPNVEVLCGEHALRRPTGLDQLAVANIALDNPAAAAAAMVRRCATRGNADTLSIEVAEAALDRADPQAVCELTLTCIECSAPFTSSLDAGEILARELIASSKVLDVSVHILAMHYHWSYSEILQLPLHRRRRLVDLASDAATVGAG
jgi:hypothetical protein